MNNQSPLVPQGSFLEQKNKSRARVEIAVFVVLAIHGIGLLALLMQGCQKPPESANPAETTNAAPAFAEPTNAPSPPATNTATAPSAPSPATTTSSTPPEMQPAIAAPAAGATDYTIVKGDNFSTLAKKFHLSVKALQDANPGVDSAKLKIGQKIHIPAAPAAASAPAAAAPDAAAASGEETYTVKSGDTLGAIATKKGVTVKALRAANDLKTDRITVGQKLKIPAKPASATPTTEPAATSTPPVTPGAPSH